MQILANLNPIKCILMAHMLKCKTFCNTMFDCIINALLYSYGDYYNPFHFGFTHMNNNLGFMNVSIFLPQAKLPSFFFQTNNS